MDWSDLNGELLGLITKKLEDISNIIRFCAVCKNWRKQIQPCDHPPQLPWLVIYEPGSDHLHFFCLYSNQTQSLPVPRSRSLQETSTLMYHGPRLEEEDEDDEEEELYLLKEGTLLGPSKRYILVHEYGFSLSFFNPITGSHLKMTCKDFGISPCLVFFATHPEENGDVVILDGEARKGDTVLVLLLMLSNGSVSRKTVPVPDYGSVGIYKGKMVVFDEEGATMRKSRVIKAKNGEEILIVPSNLGFTHLVEAGDDLLAVIYHNLGMEDEEDRFEVYRLEDIDGMNPHLVRMSDGIGDLMCE